MSFANVILFALLGGVVAGGGYWLGKQCLSSESRRERRRRRSNARVTSTARRPMVKFSVRTKEKRRK